VSDEPEVPPVVAERAMMPGRNGGQLIRGGKKGGRTPNIIREGLRKNLLKTARRMEQRVREMAEMIEQRKAWHRRRGEEEQSNRLLEDQERLLNAEHRLAEYLAKYGIGTTITETNTQGYDAIRVIREPAHHNGDSDN
jgi:hypothetical protein